MCDVSPLWGGGWGEPGGAGSYIGTKDVAKGRF